MTPLCENNAGNNQRYISRRDFWFKAGMGIGGGALVDLLARDGLLAAEPASGPGSCLGSAGITDSPYLPKPPHFKPRAKSVIHLFMSGGVSHIDTFDYKPALEKYHGVALAGGIAGVGGDGEIIVRQGYPGPLMKSPFKFKQHGQSGSWVSELFPHMSTIVDDLAFIHSATGKSNDHVLSHYEWNTGMILMGFPSVGAWVTYGLGSENGNLPAYVVLYDHRGGPFSGPTNWHAGFLPAAYQGTVFRPVGDPILDLKPDAQYSSVEEERRKLDALASINQNHAEKHPGVSDLSARISSYELAYRMQGCAPEAIDISQESEETKQLYGLNDRVTAPFGRQCLMARRLVERGVRFVQLYSGAIVNQNVDTWDAHGNIMENHTMHAAEVDKPITGLITDLKRRGLIDETVVLWQSEFGRMPVSQRALGRDHNPGAQTVWMCGGGIQGGQHIGASDEVGYQAAEQIIWNHDIHASLLHLLGLDHKRLTYYFNGRNMRLTDVHGELIPQIVGATGKETATA
ncbi:MAG: DUF1501 domain-containing protein [Acidobacteria bacterium]|nr:DUF1501 domain-containing protein [Acidobacteriota bacterium]